MFIIVFTLLYISVDQPVNMLTFTQFNYLVDGAIGCKEDCNDTGVVLTSASVASPVEAVVPSSALPPFFSFNRMDLFCWPILSRCGSDSHVRRLPCLTGFKCESTSLDWFRFATRCCGSSRPKFDNALEDLLVEGEVGWVGLCLGLS